MPFKPADPGKFDRRVEIQSPMNGPQDPNGLAPINWHRDANRWASIDALSGSELFIAQEINALCSHLVKMRHVPAMTDKSRIVYRRRILNVLWFKNPEEAGVETWCYCTENLTKRRAV